MRITRAGEMITAMLAVGGLALGGHGIVQIVGEYLPARIKHISCVLDNPNSYVELCAEDLNSFRRKEGVLGVATLEIEIGAILTSAGSAGFSALRNKRENLEGRVW